MFSWLLKSGRASTPPKPQLSQCASGDAEDDVAYQIAAHEPVYLVTTDLERSVHSNRQTPSWLPFVFPKHVKLVKHWGILIRDTVYELARDQSAINSGVKLNTLDWSHACDSFDKPIKIGETSLDDEALVRIGN
jgi:hypothetical protein